MNFGRDLEPEEIEFTDRVDAVYLREGELGFDEAVRAYRQIETEFVDRAGTNEWDVLETKRRITEWLLNFACRSGQPQEVCRELWEEMLERGFSGIDKRHTMGGIYARCCQMNGEFDAGIAVLEPLIAELEQLLQRTTLTSQNRKFCEENIRIHKKIIDELKAGLR